MPLASANGAPWKRRFEDPTSRQNWCSSVWAEEGPRPGGGVIVPCPRADCTKYTPPIARKF